MRKLLGVPKGKTMPGMPELGDGLSSHQYEATSVNRCDYERRDLQVDVMKKTILTAARVTATQEQASFTTPWRRATPLAM